MLTEKMLGGYLSKSIGEGNIKPMSFELGTKVKSSSIVMLPNGKVEEMNIFGVVVKNVKLPGDICVRWDNGQLISYDEETAIAFLEIVN